MTRKLALRTISSYDQLVEGIVKGDEECISETRCLMMYWSECASDNQVRTLTEAMRCHLGRLSQGPPKAMLPILESVKDLAERILEQEEE